MNVLQHFKPIKLIAMDVDGVLTNGNLLLLNDGQMARSMNIKDGYAIQLAIKKGYHVLVISGAVDEAVRMRLHNLGVTNVHLGIVDKATLLQENINQLKLDSTQVMFIGDDMPDYDAMKLVGLSCCPADAVSDIRNVAHYISPFKGGEGCVRDVIEKVLKLNQDWENDLNVVAQ